MYIVQTETTNNLSCTSLRTSCPVCQNNGYYTFIEMFAGQAEATRMMRYAGHCAAKLDYKYHVATAGKQNYMDILTPSGFLCLGFLDQNSRSDACMFVRSSSVPFVMMQTLYPI